MTATIGLWRGTSAPITAEVRELDGIHGPRRVIWVETGGETASGFRGVPLSSTIAAVAVAWTLAWPGVTGAIVGARSPEQLDGWIDAATLELTGEDLGEIAQAMERTGAGTGPRRPAEVEG